MVDASDTLTWLFVTLAGAVAAAFPVGIFWAERRLGAALHAARRAATFATAGSALWVGLTGALGAAGALRFDSTPPTAVLAIVAMWILALALGISRVGERLALGLPLAALVGVHAFRLPLELLMHRAYAEGVMPVQMSYSGWNFDIVTGISAIAVAGLLAAGRMPLWGVRLWNWMGMVLLAIVVTIAVLSTPTPLRVFMNEPANEWITHAPFVWLPTVMVLTAILGHIVLLRRLRAESARVAQAAPVNRARMRPMIPAAVLALSAAAPLAGQQAASAGSLPDTPLGAVARAMVDALNTSDVEIRRFVEAHASPNPAGRVTAVQYAAALRKLREQSGGMELVTTMPGGGATVRMLLRSRTGGHFLGVEIGPDPQQADRFAFLSFHPMLSDPRTGSGLWNPEGEEDDAAIIAHVRRSVEKLVADDRFSGVVLVARGDDVLLEEAYGLADLERRVPNTPATRYHVGSIDKMFTAVAIAQLVEQGKLGFDDTLEGLLPEYPDPGARRTVTIRHLLTHTAGIGDPFRSPVFDPRKKMAGAQSDWFPLFAHEPLRFEPGARHEYSNGGYQVLGAVIENLTGQRYHDHVRDNVFRAAGMTDTEPHANGVIPNAAVRYYREPLDDPLAIDTRIPKIEAPPGVGEAMGGSYLTAHDLFRFARALRTNRLLSPAMTDTVVTGKVAVGPGSARYAFGFYDVDFGTPVRGHSGGGAGSGIDADLEIVWDADYTVIVVGNYDTPASRAIAQGIVRLIARKFRPSTSPR